MLNVYLVDDDQTVLDNYYAKRGLFSGCGFEICGSARSSVKALEEIRAKRPEAVISGLDMPELSGIGLLEALRRENNPVLFAIISDSSEFEEVRKFFANLDGFDYILKPVGERCIEDLLNRLSAKIWRANALDALADEETKAQTPSRDLNGILKYLAEHFAHSHSLGSVGRIFDINPNTVCNLFAKHLGTTFVSYLTSVRMDNAAALLRSSDMSIKDIGTSCGYASYFYFTKVFSKTFDKTPTEYKKDLSR